MQELDTTNIGTFLMDHTDYVYRLWVYRRMPTIMEMEQGLATECVYEDVFAKRVMIRNAIEIPGDILLECEEVLDRFDPINNRKYFSYYRLSDVHLERIEGEKAYEEETE